MKEREAMKILQSARSDFADLGLDADQSTTQNSLFNRKNVLALFTLVLAFISTIACIFYDENTFQEYTVSAYLSSSFWLATVMYAIFSWKSRMIFKFMDDAEKILNESKLHAS